MNLILVNSQLAEDRDLALALHRLLSDIDGTRLKNQMESLFHQRFQEVEAKALSLQRHVALNAKIAEAKVALNHQGQEMKAKWLQLKSRLSPTYSELEAALKASSVHVPSLRPTNYRRTAVHVAAGLFAMVMLEVFSNYKLAISVVAGAWFVYAWVCEVIRKFSPAFNEKIMKLYGSVAHPHERFKINSATWYASALFLISLTQSTIWGVTAVMVLAVGDPVAAFVGRRYGRIRLLHGRSLEGTLAFFVSAAVTLFAVLTLWHASELSLAKTLMISLVASGLGAVAELLSLRVDDNFSIPMSAAAGAALAMGLLG
jgi:dolichol kinase